MRKINTKVLMAVAAFATIFASTMATSACSWCMYQPEEPKSLRDE